MRVVFSLVCFCFIFYANAQTCYVRVNQVGYPVGSNMTAVVLCSGCILSFSFFFFTFPGKRCKEVEESWKKRGKKKGRKEKKNGRKERDKGE